MGMGARIRAVREGLQLSQEQFGEMAGVKKIAQYNYEREERIPDASYLAAVAKMGGDVLFILTGVSHENVARGTVELSVLERFRALEVQQRYAVVKLLAALNGQDKPSKNWENH